MPAPQDRGHNNDVSYLNIELKLILERLLVYITFLIIFILDTS
jgi:hypothetical protein